MIEKHDFLRLEALCQKWNLQTHDWQNDFATALFLEKDYWQNMQNTLANAINKALAG